MTLSALSRVPTELESTPAPDLGLRAALAVREFVLGHLTLSAATDLAGVSDVEFIGLLSNIESLAALGPVDEMALGRGDPAPRLSAIIPVYNEEQSLPVLHERLSLILASLGTYEIVFVDDGSRDRSVEVILDLQRRNPAVKLIRFSRNFGHQAALSAGIDNAKGDAVILMDADLQDPPELLAELVERWEDGFQVVYAVRQKRDEGLFKRASAGAFYRLLSAVSDIPIPVDTGDFCLMDRAVVDVLRQLPEKHRFLRGLRSWAGFTQVGVPYERPERYAGEVKYTFRKMVKLALDGLMAFTSLPLRIASYLGFLTAAAGVGYLGIAIFARLFTGAVAPGWTSLVAVTLIVGGMQLLMMGVLGAYIARIYDETKARPMYVIAERHELASRQARPPHPLSASRR